MTTCDHSLETWTADRTAVEWSSPTTAPESWRRWSRCSSSGSARGCPPLLPAGSRAPARRPRACRSPTTSRSPIAAAYPELNDARTLGAVVVRGEGELDPPSWILAFNLTTRKQVGKQEGRTIRALDHGFWVDRETF